MLPDRVALNRPVQAQQARDRPFPVSCLWLLVHHGCSIRLFRVLSTRLAVRGLGSKLFLVDGGLRPPCFAPVQTSLPRPSKRRYRSSLKPSFSASRWLPHWLVKPSCDGCACGGIGPNSKFRIHAQPAFITASKSYAGLLGGLGTKSV